MTDSEHFTGHRLHGQLDELSRKLDAVASDGWTDQNLQLLEGARGIAERSRRVTALQEPALVPGKLLDELAAGADHTMARVDAGAGESDISAIHDSLYSLVAAVALLPTQLPPSLDKVAVRLNGATLAARRKAEEAIAELALNEREAIEQLTSAARATSAEAESSAAQARADVQAARDEALEGVKAADERLAAAKAAFEARVTALESSSAAAVQSVETALAGIETRAQNAETGRKSEFDKALKEQKEAFEGALSVSREQHQALLESIESTAARADEVLQLAGATTLAGRWISQAERNFWERVAWIVLLLVLSVGSVVFGYLARHQLTAPPGSGIVDTIAFYFPRLPLAIVTIVVIGFVVQQASRRATWEARDRRVANELTALPALIDRLEPAEQRALLSQVAQRYLPGSGIDADNRVSERATSQPSAPQLVGGVSYGLATAVSTAVALGVALVVALSR